MNSDLNPFSYAYSNPVGYIDIRGLEGVGHWTFPPGRQREAILSAQNRTGPDFVQISGSLYVFGGNVTLSRSGNVFVSYGISRGYPNVVRGLGVSLNAGDLIIDCPKSQRASRADRFLRGFGYSATAHKLIGGGAAYSPGVGAAVLYGVGLGVEVSPGGFGDATSIKLFGW